MNPRFLVFFVLNLPAVYAFHLATQLITNFSIIYRFSTGSGPVFGLFLFFIALNVFGADRFAFFVDFMSALQVVFGLRNGLAVRNLNVVQEGNDRPLDRFYHFREHFVSFEFIFDQGVLLTVSPEVDPFFEGIHSIQMVHPLAVDDAEHDGFFQFLHGFFAKFVESFVIEIDGNLFQFFLNFDTAHVFQLFDGYGVLRYEVLLHLGQEAGKIPFFGIQFFIGILVEFSQDDVVDHAHDRILKSSAVRTWRRWL